eukprot:scaffold54441_cov18-Tisochrysis_lutea.AAC.2
MGSEGPSGPITTHSKQPRPSVAFNKMKGITCDPMLICFTPFRSKGRECVAARHTIAPCFKKPPSYAPYFLMHAANK